MPLWACFSNPVTGKGGPGRLMKTPLYPPSLWRFLFFFPDWIFAQQMALRLQSVNWIANIAPAWIRCHAVIDLVVWYISFVFSTWNCAHSMIGSGGGWHPLGRRWLFIVLNDYSLVSEWQDTIRSLVIMLVALLKENDRTSFRQVSNKEHFLPDPWFPLDWQSLNPLGPLFRM